MNSQEGFSQLYITFPEEKKMYIYLERVFFPMKLFMVICLFLSFLSLSLVSAQSYERYSLTADVQEDMVLFTLEAIGSFSGETVFTLPPDVENLQTTMDSSSLLCFSEEVIGTTHVSCFLPEGSHTVLFTFESTYPLLFFDGRTLFSHRIEVDTAYFLFTIALPKGYVVEDARFITPEPDRIYSDGQRIILSWDEQDHTGLFDVSVFMAPVVNSYSFFWSLVVALLLAASGYFFFLRRKRRLIKNFFSFFDILLENERKVLDALLRDGTLWQKQLQITTGLSKVKLSRLLQSMEKRGLVRREAYGTSNRIHLIPK